jgi:hypothetical protein
MAPSRPSRCALAIVHRTSISARAAVPFLASMLALAPARAQDSTRAHTDSAKHPVQIGGLLQVWYLSGHTITNAHDTYRVRRADLKFIGDITPRVHFRISVDAAKLLNLAKTTTGAADSLELRDVAVDQRGRILQEASVNMTFGPHLRVDLGQQIIPLAMEGVISSAQIETIERTMFIAERTRGAGIADVRDIGASARGTVARYLDYQAGVFNEVGESQNSVDVNDQKASVGRLSLRIPGLDGLRIGGSGAIEGGPSPMQHRTRAGGEAQFKNGGLTIRTEVMGARDGLLRRLGYYALAAERPVPNVELVARWDNWDPDLHRETSAPDLFERQVVLGANYYLDAGGTRCSANLVRSSFPRSGAMPSATLLLLAIQAVW